MNQPLSSPAMVETSTGHRRRRKIVAGEGMVVPTRRLLLSEDGRSEELRPGRDRLSPYHPVVIARPELFRPAMAGDRPTARAMSALLERASAQLRREAAQPSWRLPRAPMVDQPWRLP